MSSSSTHVHTPTPHPSPVACFSSPRHARERAAFPHGRLRFVFNRVRSPQNSGKVLRFPKETIRALVLYRAEVSTATLDPIRLDIQGTNSCHFGCFFFVLFLKTDLCRFISSESTPAFNISPQIMGNFWNVEERTLFYFASFSSLSRSGPTFATFIVIFMFHNDPGVHIRRQMKKTKSFNFFIFEYKVIVSRGKVQYVYCG